MKNLPLVFFIFMLLFRSDEKQIVKRNNPGNIIDGSWSQKQPGYVGRSGRFAVFRTFGDGVNAMKSLLHTYVYKHNLYAVADIIRRWAPPASTGGDNTDQQVSNYIAYVTKTAGVTVVRHESDIPVIAWAMAQFEHGTQLDKNKFL